MLKSTQTHPLNIWLWMSLAPYSLDRNLHFSTSHSLHSKFSLCVYPPSALSHFAGSFWRSMRFSPLYATLSSLACPQCPHQPCTCRRYSMNIYRHELSSASMAAYCLGESCANPFSQRPDLCPVTGNSSPGQPRTPHHNSRQVILQTTYKGLPPFSCPNFPQLFHQN